MNVSSWRNERQRHEQRRTHPGDGEGGCWQSRRPRQSWDAAQRSHAGGESTRWTGVVVSSIKARSQSGPEYEATQPLYPKRGLPKKERQKPGTSRSCDVIAFLAFDLFACRPSRCGRSGQVSSGARDTAGDYRIWETGLKGEKHTSDWLAIKYRNVSGPNQPRWL
jgi:hypothetical protein